MHQSHATHLSDVLHIPYLAQTQLKITYWAGTNKTTTHTYTTITKKRTNGPRDSQYTFVVQGTMQGTLLWDLLEPIDLPHPVISYQAPSPQHIHSMVYKL